MLLTSAVMSQSRSVYVIEPTLVYPDDSVKMLDDNFWHDLHAHVSKLGLPARTVPWEPSEIRVAAKKVRTREYFYVSKKRAAVDTPHIWNDDDNESPVETGGNCSPNRCTSRQQARAVSLSARRLRWLPAGRVLTSG